MAGTILAAVVAVLAVLAPALVLRFALRPRRCRLDAASTGLPVESIRFDSPSGARLAGWFLAGSPGACGVLLLHGVKANRSAHVERMRFLRAAGYATLAIDFQAHGDSTGARITMGMLESLDARAALAKLRERLPGQRVGVIGVSLGGASALLGPAPLDADALVLESVFPDLESALRNRLRLRFGDLGRTLTPLVLVVGRIVVGFDLANLRPIERIGEVPAPVLVISGIEDLKTTIAETRALFAQAGARKTLWEIPGAGHIDLCDFAGPAYRERILTFFQATLRGSA